MIRRLINSLVQKCIQYKDEIYLTICLVVHVMWLGYFMYAEVRPLVLLNVISTLFYILMIVLHKEMKKIILTMTYFEVILSAVVATIVLGMEAYFWLYIIFAVYCMFFLSKEIGAIRYLYQVFGGVTLLFLFLSQNIFGLWCSMFRVLIASDLYLLSCGNAVVVFILYFFFVMLYAKDVELFTERLNDFDEELDFSASHDALTGLRNRKSMRKLMHELKKVHTGVVHIAKLDVDNFKNINDRYGHEVGDNVLQFIAHNLKDILGDMYIGRWTGEEFIVIDVNDSDDEFIAKIEEFHKKIQKKSVVTLNGEIQITLTIGIWSGGDMRRLDYYMMEADNLLYYGKRGKKNCVVTQKNFSKLKL